jgi:hypothetical protein
MLLAPTSVYAGSLLRNKMVQYRYISRNHQIKSGVKSNLLVFHLDLYVVAVNAGDVCRRGDPPV